MRIFAGEQDADVLSVCVEPGKPCFFAFFRLRKIAMTIKMDIGRCALWVLLAALPALAVGQANKAADPAAIKLQAAIQLLDTYQGNRGQLEAARASLNAIIAADPKNASAHRELARYHIMTGALAYGEYDQAAMLRAEASVKKALAINPRFAEAYVLLGHLYRNMDRHEDAVASLKQAESLGAKDPWLHLNWAELLLDEDKPADAAKRYRHVIESKTPNKKAMGAAYSGMIKYYQAIGNMQGADEAYVRFIAHDPKRAWSYGNYGTFLLCQRNDPDRSIEQSRKALQLMEYGMARFWLAGALYVKWADRVMQGDVKSGEPYLAEARQYQPDTIPFLGHLEDCRILERISHAKVKVHVPLKR